MSQILDYLGRPITVNKSAEESLREENQRLRLKNRQIMQTVDAAGMDEFSARLFANADSLGPNAAFSEGVRSRVRNRGRHAYINGNYARGLVRTHSSDLIGACPRPQITIPGDDSGAVAAAIERRYLRWAKEIGLGHTYRLAEKCRGHSGEAFLFVADNDRLNHPVKMTVRDFEPEQCLTPWQRHETTTTIDGIEFDALGNRIRYWVLRYHPNDTYTVATQPGEGNFIAFDARNVFHWFEQDRSGQVRGLSRISAALPILEQVRRWNLATLTAAEFASMIAGYIKSTIPPQDGQPTQISNWEFFEIIKGALLTFPHGFEPEQMESKHPNAQHSEYKREQLNEAGRGSGAPLNVVTGNSSGYNYSSGRLDHVPYQREKRIERYDFEGVVMDRVFFKYVENERAIGLIDSSVPDVSEWDLEWNYDGFGSIDELKDAKSDDTRLKNGTATIYEICREYGQDPRAFLRKLFAEIKLFEANGAIHPFAAATKAPPAPTAETTPEDEDETDKELEDEEEGDEEEAGQVNRLNGHFNLNGVHK